MRTRGRESMRFAHLTIEYDDRVLRPRPWTELQSRWAAALISAAGPGRMLELCSGAGHIGLLAAALAGRDLVTVDLNPAATYFTRLNAEGAGLAHRVEAREGRLEAALAPTERFALVIADPPWVVSTRVSDYPEDPDLAINGGDDGLSVARACVAACLGHVHGGGSVLLQLGTAEQAELLIAELDLDEWTVGERRHGEGGIIQQLVATGDPG